jgi:hypothetical protein
MRARVLVQAYPDGDQRAMAGGTRMATDPRGARARGLDRLTRHPHQRPPWRWTQLPPAMTRPQRLRGHWPQGRAMRARTRPRPQVHRSPGQVQGDTIAAEAAGRTTGRHLPNKLHKGQASPTPADARGTTDDNSRARELMQAQQGAAAAGEFGSQAAIQAAAHLHSQNVDRVAKAAISQGVQPVTSAGDELIMLGPQELAQWASDNLDSAKGQWW